MPSSRIPSPARSQGQKSTPRRYRPRSSRSMGSPARSNTSVKLSAMVQMDTFALSPMPSRRSVLADTTAIDIPTRKSWWKKLDENSREIMEVLNTKEPVNANTALEEYIDVDVLSQEKEKKNYTLELPESSDGESINSIVIPQRKLFTQKEVGPQKKFTQLIDNRESLAKLNKTQQDDEKTLNVGRKNLLNQGTKNRTKPLFPSALLNTSLNKTVANKVNDFATTNTKGQGKNLFGNRGGTKRKNMFTDFIVSDSEDEIPEIQPKVFGFQNKAEQTRRPSLKSQDGRERHLISPTSSITETEMDDWRFLPSSTMVDHQLEDGLRTTPSKRARLSKLSESIESSNKKTDLIANKTKSLSSKNLSKSKNMCVNNDVVTTNNNEQKSVTADQNEKTKTSVNEVDAPSKSVLREQSLRKNKSKSSKRDKSKATSLHKTVNENVCDVVNDLEDQNSNNSRYHKLNGDKSLKPLSRIDQVLQSDDDEDFSLVYDNDDEQKCEHEEMKMVAEIETLKVTKVVRNRSTTQLQYASQSGSNYVQNKSNTENNTTNTRNIENVAESVDTEEVYDNNGTENEREKSVSQQIDTAEGEIEEQRFNRDDEEVTEQDTNDGDCSVSQEQPFGERSENGSKSNIHNQELEIDTQTDNTTEKLHDVEMELSKQSPETNVDNDEENIEEHDNHREDMQNINQDVVDNTIINYKSKENNDSQNKFHVVDETKESKTKLVTTNKHKEKAEAMLPSPEICRQLNKTSDAQSFIVDGRNASVRKTKSNIKNLTIKPSLASLRESTGLFARSRNSSAEGSGWDSHRTTRATLRQTFGKDFTPRKSLRALVMEKSAKRRTNITEINTEFSRIPQANSTELPVSEPFDLDVSQNKDKSDEVSRVVHQKRKINTQQAISSNNGKNENDPQLSLHLEKNTSLNASKISKSKRLSSEIELQKMNQSSRNTSDNHDGEDVQENSESDKEISDDENAENTPEIESQDMNESADEEEINESNQEASNDDSDDVQEMNESNQDASYNQVADPVPEMDQEESDVEDASDAENMHDSNHEASDDDDANDAQEMNEDVREMDDSNHEEVSYDEGVADAEEMDESDHVISGNVADDEDGLEEPESDEAREEDEDDQEIQESDVAQEESDDEASRDVDDADEAQGMNESDDVRVESDNEVSHDDGNAHETQDTNDSDQEVSQNALQENLESEHEVSSDNDNEGNEISNENLNEADEVDYHEYEGENNQIDNELSIDRDESNVHKISPECEESEKTRQTTLEMYLQKVKNRKLERKKVLVDEIMNSLKAPARDILNPFKVPAIPKLRRMKTQQLKPKVKPMKSSVINMDMLPAEVLEDMKYKPPKRYRPTNASWITKRLYKFLETKLEPKYDYKARVRSEKLVETIYNFAKDIRRHDVAPSEAVDALKREMARLDVVKTHVDFYEFFHEYMPREVRVKVVPDLFNKISLPKRGVFSDILR